MLGIFYGDTDKKEIRGWDEALRKELFQKLSKYVTQEQIKEHDNAVESQFEVLSNNISDFRREINSLTITFASKNELNAFASKSDLDELGRKFDEIPAPPPIEPLQKDLDELKQKVAAIPTPQPPINIEPLKKDLDALKQKVVAIPTPQPPIDIEPLKKDLDALKQKVAAIPTPQPPIDIEPLKKESVELSRRVTDLEKKIPSAPLIEIDSLKKELGIHRTEIASLKAQLAEVEPLKKELAALKTLVSEIEPIKKAVRQIHAGFSQEIIVLKKELADSEQKIAAQEQEIAALKKIVGTMTPPPPPPPTKSPFFLPEQNDVFISNDREQIPEKIKAVLDIGDIQKYLIDNPSENSKQFQKLLNNHIVDAKKFVSKLKIDDLEDEELSENVTAKYFKTFYGKIFENLLIAIKRGLKNANENSKKFYLGLLVKVNEYLTRCGIYSVNTTADRKAESEETREEQQ